MKWDEINENGFYWVIGMMHEPEPYVAEIELDHLGKYIVFLRMMDYGHPISEHKECEFIKVPPPIMCKGE